MMPYDVSHHCIEYIHDDVKLYTAVITRWLRWWTLTHTPELIPVQVIGGVSAHVLQVKVPLYLQAYPSTW